MGGGSIGLHGVRGSSSSVVFGVRLLKAQGLQTAQSRSHVYTRGPKVGSISLLGVLGCAPHSVEGSLVSAPGPHREPKPSQR